MPMRTTGRAFPRMKLRGKARRERRDIAASLTLPAGRLWVSAAPFDPAAPRVLDLEGWTEVGLMSSDMVLGFDVAEDSDDFTFATWGTSPRTFTMELKVTDIDREAIAALFRDIEPCTCGCQYGDHNDTKEADRG